MPSMWQMHTMVTAIMLLLCLVAQVHADTVTSLQPLDQCGGKGGSCNLFTCQDAPYPTAACKTGLSCVRHNEWFYQCMQQQKVTYASLADSSSQQQSKQKQQQQGHPASSIGTLAAFGQCGGRGGDCGVKKICVDNIYPEDTCPAGTSCMRHSEWYWQCVPAAAVTVDSHARLAASDTDQGARQIESAVTAGSAAGLIKGTPLVLDVGSLTKQASNQLPIINAEQCSLYCQNTRGCTAWSFCNSATGCGSGCKDYVANNPTFTAASFYSALSNPLMYMAPAIRNFGPFGKTSGCAATVSGDKWPLGMCSLKVLSRAEQPEFESQEGAAGDGWVSGWFAAPSVCVGLSSKVCQRCLSSSRPESCFECAKATSTRSSLLELVISGPLLITAADGCM